MEDYINNLDFSLFFNEISDNTFKQLENNLNSINLLISNISKVEDIVLVKTNVLEPQEKDIDKNSLQIKPKQKLVMQKRTRNPKIKMKML